ncbi:hypothetical protein ACVWY2_002152 [Bradyrhizobium sp. JR6.1]
MAWEIPAPASEIRHETSCVPVPDAPMMPILPRLILLANASGAPPITAVPQSGPIIRRPAARACCLSDNSSSRDTLSLNIRTCRPRLSALRASAAANSPGTEISARLISGLALTAAAIECGRQAACVSPWVFGLSSDLIALSRASRAAGSDSALTAITRSLPFTAVPSSSSPALRMIAAFDGVPIINAASITPGEPATSRDSRISATESR